MFIGHHTARQQSEHLATDRATKPLYEVPDFSPLLNDVSFTLAVFVKVAIARTFVLQLALNGREWIYKNGQRSLTVKDSLGQINQAKLSSSLTMTTVSFSSEASSQLLFQIYCTDNS
jgi:hypothetical protein